MRQRRQALAERLVNLDVTGAVVEPDRPPEELLQSPDFLAGPPVVKS